MINQHLIKLPEALSSVTSIAQDEVDPIDLGMTHAAREAIWNSVVDIYRTGSHPGISLCMRRRGQIFLHRAIGHAQGNGPEAHRSTPKKLMKPETPVCYFSASKAVTALLIHMIRHDKHLNLHDPVSFYRPEFGKKGKKNITIHQVLSHRSGVPGLPSGTPIETLWDNDQIWKLLCDAESSNVSGDKLEYHALTGGYILEKVAESVSGMTIQELLNHYIREPMGMKYFRYGIEEEHADVLATNHPTGVRPFFPISFLVKRALGGSMDELEQVTNSPEFRKAVIPAGNIMGTAEEMCRFFQMMLDNGRWQEQQVCDPMTVKRLTHEYASVQFDRTLMLPMRYSAGLMLGGSPFGIWGKRSARSYGHIGLLNKLCWADPKRDVSVCLLTTGVPVIANVIPALARFLNAIDQHCSRP